MKTMIYDKQHFDIYTDGGGFLDGSLGTWAFVIPELLHPNSHRSNGHICYSKTGSLSNCQSIGAEVLAVAYGLEFIANSIDTTGMMKTLTVRTDSHTVLDGVNGRIDAWAANGWKTLSPAGKRKNAEGRRGLSEKEKWIFLYACIQRIKGLGIEVTAELVKGHSGDYWNELCDRMCKSSLAYACRKRG